MRPIRTRLNRPPDRNARFTLFGVVRRSPIPHALAGEPRVADGLQSAVPRIGKTTGKAALQQTLHLPDRPLKLLVRFSRKAFGPPREFKKLSPSRLLTAFGARSRTEVERNDGVNVVLVEYRSASNFVDFIVRSLIDLSAAAQRRRSGCGTGRDAAQRANADQ